MIIHSKIKEKTHSILKLILIKKKIRKIDIKQYYREYIHTLQIFVML